LKIGGLLLDHPEGLEGHSDGDVLLHAITDALLGAVACGDIGSFFPPGDARWKGADSAIFLATALEEVRNAGYTIANVDTTLVLAAPRIAPVAERLREHVASLLHIAPDCVGIKAKTPEGLNQDHVAVAHAVVLLERPEDPEKLAQMAASVGAEKAMEDVVRKLLEDAPDSPARRPTYNTDDIT
jgi:2-C-methyl-D-erythritol 2,4-cyclodiphosphate synthase